jgi:hypothetical protein
MPTDEQQIMNNRVQELVKKTSEWTDNELSELRRLMDGLAVGGGVIQALAQFRTNVELIAAIRKFDKASGELVETTNKLTRNGLWMSGAALMIALASLAVSVFALRR